jgi:hypothetical protein
MNESRLPTHEEIDGLTAFLPRLYADGFRPITSWSGDQKRADGVLQLGYPIYDPVVEEFFREAASAPWLDHGYKPEQAGKMLRDEELVKRASLPEIRTMLTYCVRGERFSDGHWAAMIEEGHIRRLLERLVELRSEMAG